MGTFRWWCPYLAMKAPRHGSGASAYLKLMGFKPREAARPSHGRSPWRCRPVGPGTRPGGRRRHPAASGTPPPAACPTPGKATPAQPRAGPSLPGGAVLQFAAAAGAAALRALSEPVCAGPLRSPGAPTVPAAAAPGFRQIGCVAPASRAPRPWVGPWPLWRIVRSPDHAPQGSQCCLEAGKRGRRYGARHAALARVQGDALQHLPGSPPSRYPH